MKRGPLPADFGANPRIPFTDAEVLRSSNRIYIPVAVSLLPNVISSEAIMPFSSSEPYTTYLGSPVDLNVVELTR